jgi:beta-glucosidase/6-phospho-beta-glucosidase/beta-galactosidase
MSGSGLFQSFWMAGFESACHINAAGTRLDLICTTQHDRQVDADYAALLPWNIRTVREGMRWHLIDRGGRYDFASAQPMLEAAERHGIEILWTLCHYGWPDDLELMSAAFVERFAGYCAAAARNVRERTDRVPFYCPINEISFFAWAAGEVAYIYPGYTGRGHEVKQQLVRAAIAGIEAIRVVEPGARILQIDPLIHVVPPADRPDLAGAAAAQRVQQFDALDMLAGIIDPQLGGDPCYLDILGVNYYHANQWEHPDMRLRWEDTPRDPRWVPLHRLLAEVHQRYSRPIFLAETSHFGSGRARWIAEVTDEVIQARLAGVPVEGICLYPIIDRPDWDDLDHWHKSGLWDLRPVRNGGEGVRLERVLSQDYAAEVRRCQARVD